MNEEEARKQLISLWLDKSNEALESAKLEIQAGHLNSCVNRLYYCCFYAVTALLLSEGKQFSRHSAVKAEFNRLFARTGKIDAEWSRFYQKLFDDRQQGDYIPTASFDAQEISKRITLTEDFLKTVKSLISST